LEGFSNHWADADRRLPKHFDKSLAIIVGFQSHHTMLLENFKGDIKSIEVE